MLQGYNCSSSDVTLFKGFFQTPTFATLILFALFRPTTMSSDEEKKRDNETNNENGDIKEIKFLPSRTKDKIWTLSFMMFSGARFAAFYGAVLFMPMADYIVCIATTPIFSYLFSILLIKTKLTILKVRY